jgi:hypothetical protein
MSILPPMAGIALSMITVVGFGFKRAFVRCPTPQVRDWLLEPGSRPPYYGGGKDEETQSGSSYLSS